VTQIEVLNEHNCTICIHGDDTTLTADGGDCYALVKEAGMYREVGI
jgi:ethanolamine-phosphate cytidylyltransferase